MGAKTAREVAQAISPDYLDGRRDGDGVNAYARHAVCLERTRLSDFRAAHVGHVSQ